MPHATAAAHGTPARIPFMAPMTQKAPTPMASAQSTHSSVSLTPYARSRWGQARKVATPVPTQIHRYSISSIQNALLPLPSSRSLTVPPPTAVMVPTMVLPRMSIPRVAAARVPVMANTAVPNQSAPRSKPGTVAPSLHGNRGIESGWGAGVAGTGSAAFIVDLDDAGDRFGPSVDTPRFGIDATGDDAGLGSWMCLAIAGRRDWSPAREANARASAMDAISDTVPLTCPRAMTVPVDLVIAVAVAGDAMSRAAADASILDLIFGRVRYSLSLGARGKERGRT